MNLLSSLLYAADVAGTVNLLSAAGGGLSIAALAFSAVHSDPNGQVRWDRDMADHVLYKTLHPQPPPGARPDRVWPFRKYVKPLIGLMAAMWAVNIAVPSSTTVYAIAASEMGEQILKSSTVTKAQKALDSWLDRQIAKPAPAAN